VQNGDDLNMINNGRGGGWSVQSTSGSRGVRMSGSNGSNADYCNNGYNKK